jgi:DNA-directed RNA polymerase
MRFKDSSEQELYLKEATNAGTVELVYAGLDVLGSTPWKINKAIFDVVVTVWNSGERMGKMPPSTFDRPPPTAPAPEDMGDLELRSHHLIRQRAWAQAKANTHSERCSVNYKVEIARAVSSPFLRISHSLIFPLFVRIL